MTTTTLFTETECASCLACLNDPLPFKNSRIPLKDPANDEILCYLCWHCAGKLDDPTIDASIDRYLAYWASVDVTAGELLSEVSL